MTLKFAVIGCGEIAKKAHLPVLKRMGSVEVVSVVDVRKEVAKNVAKRFRIKKYYTDITSVLKDEEVDVVVIATPTPTHGKIAIEAAKAGKNIVVEKPLASSLEDGLKIKDAVKSNNVKLTVVQNYRYIPAVKKAKTIIHSGLIGSVISSHGISHTIWPTRWTKGKWLYCERGVLTDFTPHLVDMMLWILDSKVKDVYAFSGNITPNCNFITYAQISLLFENGSTGSIETSWISGVYHFHLLFTGTAGMLELNPRYNTLHLFHGTLTPLDEIKRFLRYSSQVTKDIITRKFFQLTQETFKQFYIDFINSLIYDRKLPVTIDEALEVLNVIEKTYEGIRNQKILLKMKNAIREKV